MKYNCRNKLCQKPRRGYEHLFASTSTPHNLPIGAKPPSSKSKGKGRWNRANNNIAAQAAGTSAPHVPATLLARSSAVAAALADPLATAGLACSEPPEEPERIAPWDEDEGFWNEDMRTEGTPPIVEAPPEDPALANLKRACADAKNRHKPQLAATLQRAVDEYIADASAASPATIQDSATEARKTMKQISGGLVWLENTFKQHMGRIAAERAKLEHTIDARRNERESALQALWDDYQLKVQNEENCYKQFMEDIQAENDTLKEEELGYQRQYRFQTAQHESAQLKLVSQYTTVQGPTCPVYDMDAPTAHNDGTTRPPARPTTDLDPSTHEGLVFAQRIAMESDIPLPAVQHVLDVDHRRRNTAPSPPAPPTPIGTALPHFDDGSHLHITASNRTYMPIVPPTPNQPPPPASPRPDYENTGGQDLAVPRTGCTPVPSPTERADSPLSDICLTEDEDMQEQRPSETTA